MGEIKQYIIENSEIPQKYHTAPEKTAIYQEKTKSRLSAGVAREKIIY